MCTLIILRRATADWPVIIGANRDEMMDRPWSPPAAHWPDRPGVVAGKDLLAGGTWLGVNGEGVAAAILNRQGTLGPAPGLRSRGELVLEALDHPDAAAAAKALGDLDPRAFRAFNMVIADNRDAFWIRSLGGQGSTGMRVEPIPAGLSMLTAQELNDANSARIRTYQPRFAKAPAPDPARGDWAAWEALLASREQEPESGPHGAMTIVTVEADGKRGGYGTVSSSLVALSAPGRHPKPAIWRFAGGPPDVTPYTDVAL